MPASQSLAAGPDHTPGTPILDTVFENRDAAVVAVVNNHKTLLDELLAAFGAPNDQSLMPNALGVSDAYLAVNTAANAIEWRTNHRIPGGSTALPGLTIANDTDTGIYSTGADLLGFAAGGVAVIEITPTEENHFLPVSFPSGSVSAPGLTFVGDTNLGFYRIAADRMGVVTNGSKRMEWSAAGAVFISNEATPANAFMTSGLTINQATADNEILALKSTDVAHGITTIADTNTYAAFKKNSPTDGGLAADGLAGGTTIRGLNLRGIGGAVDTTKAAAAVGAVYLNAALKSGTGVASMGANANALVVADNGNAKLIVDAEGDLHVDGSTTLTAFDEYDDVALLSTVRALSMQDRKYAERVFGAFDRKQVDLLRDRGIVTITPRRGKRPDVFLSLKGLHALEIDAIRQLNKRLARIEKKLLAA